MLALLSDENFNNDIVRGLIRRKRGQPGFDVVRVQDVGLTNASDESILAFAAERNRILLTHDRATVPKHAYDRVRYGKQMPGVFVFDERVPVGQAIEEIILFAVCSHEAEWEGQVLFF